MAQVYRCGCGFRGKESELVDSKCPRDGGDVVPEGVKVEVSTRRSRRSE